MHFGFQNSDSFELSSPVVKSFSKRFEKAPSVSIFPVYKEKSFCHCPIEFFSLLSEQGRKENCILLESADVLKKYGEKSIGSAQPCLKAIGRNEKFEILALNSLGEKLLPHIGKRLSFCDSLHSTKTKISGVLKPKKGIASEQERLLTKTHADILRAIAFCFKPFGKRFPVSSGLFGAISYDFIDQFEQLPKNKVDLVKDPDYEMLFLDNLFLVDHQKKKIIFIANAFRTGQGNEEEISRCAKTIVGYEQALSRLEKANPSKPMILEKPLSIKTETDCPKEEYISMVEKCKEHILCGDVFQIVASRTTIAKAKPLPLNIYRALRSLNPSPYMFFMHSETGTLLGSSPETFIKVQGFPKIIEIMPVAGTRPRGFVNGKLDLDLDSRLENELKTDKKELAEHTMLVDLARNDIARVSKPGSRVVGRIHSVEKYSHVMHLVSNVSGELKPGLDALHAYLASMNMGTLTGAPKVKAMELLRKYEKTKRGFYGGSIGYLTTAGDFDSAIVIRSMRIKGNKAFIRTGGGIVFDSIPEKEFEETESKAKSCLRAIHAAGDLK